VSSQISRALDFATIVFAVLALAPQCGLLIPLALFLVAAQIVVRCSLSSLLCLFAAQAVSSAFNWSVKPADVARIVAALAGPVNAKTEEPGRSLGRALGSRGI
jgi:hypothetical protein